MHRHPVARPGASLVHHRAERGGEAAAKACRRGIVDRVRQRDEIGLGKIDRHIVGERAPMGKARLELAGADLLVAGAALAAPAAAGDEGNGDSVARLEARDPPPGGDDAAGNSWPGTCGRRISGSCPIQPCQSLRQRPVAPTAMTTPSSLGVGSSTVTISGDTPNCSYSMAFMARASSPDRSPRRGSQPRSCLLTDLPAPVEGCGRPRFDGPATVWTREGTRGLLTSPPRSMQT